LPNQTGISAAILFLGGLLMWWLSHIQIKAKSKQAECDALPDVC